MKKISLRILRIFLIAVVAVVGTASEFIYGATAAPPTITGFNWSPSPKSNQLFGGSITGTSFVSGTRIFFCKTGTDSFQTQPAANVSFAGSTRLILSRVLLPMGSWQFYVQTPEGKSAKSRPFNVASSLPTISS